MKKLIFGICASDPRGVMGLQNAPPVWIKHQGFRQYFAEVTKGAWVVLGRKAFEAFEDEQLFPLPNLIVLSTRLQMQDLAEMHRPAKIARSMIDINKFAITTDKPVFVCGGSQAMSMAMPWMLWVDIGQVRVDDARRPFRTSESLSVRLPSTGIFLGNTTTKAEGEDFKVTRYFRLEKKTEAA